MLLGVSVDKHGVASLVSHASSGTSDPTARTPFGGQDDDEETVAAASAGSPFPSRGTSAVGSDTGWAARAGENRLEVSLDDRGIASVVSAGSSGERPEDAAGPRTLMGVCPRGAPSSAALALAAAVAPQGSEVPPPRRVGSSSAASTRSGGRADAESLDSSKISSVKHSTITVSDPSAGGPTRTIIGRSAMCERIALSTIAQCPCDDDGGLLSLGAAAHATGECTPCKFVRSKRGCKDGVLCKLCHASHHELTRSGIRRVARRKGLEKRALFDQPDQGLDDLVKNTFLHVPDPSEVAPTTLARSRSSGGLDRARGGGPAVSADTGFRE